MSSSVLLNVVAPSLSLCLLKSCIFCVNPWDKEYITAKKSCITLSTNLFILYFILSTRTNAIQLLIPVISTSEIKLEWKNDTRRNYQPPKKSTCQKVNLPKSQLAKKSTCQNVDPKIEWPQCSGWCFWQVDVLVSWTFLQVSFFQASILNPFINRQGNLPFFLCLLKLAWSFIWLDRENSFFDISTKKVLFLL